jgi:hypothetical protein
LHRVATHFHGLLLLSLAWAAPAVGDESGTTGVPIVGELPIDSAADVRDDESKLKVQGNDFVIVPIPMSNPTLGTGLVVGGAYFYPQTEAEKKVQPASLTGAAGIYTNNKSYAVGIGQQNYWDKDNWRFTGVLGAANFRLKLRDPLPDNDSSLNWRVQGVFTQASLSRRVFDKWYLGGQLRYLDVSQDIEVVLNDPQYLLGSEIDSVGGGMTLERDTRDVPTNAYSGSRFTVKAMANRATGDEKSRYQSYEARYRYYYQTRLPVVLAADISGCMRSGQTPLWDTCRLSLRGFPVTDYLGKTSTYGQVEARWRTYKKFGLVAFAGYGYVGKSFGDALQDERVPSYGVGARYMLLKSKRINLRLDLARSDNSDAVYVGVGEAF